MRHTVQNRLDLVATPFEATNDVRRMQPHRQQGLGLRQELAAQNNHQIRRIAELGISRENARMTEAATSVSCCSDAMTHIFAAG
jgi:hypothetical protein